MKNSIIKTDIYNDYLVFTTKNGNIYNITKEESGRFFVSCSTGLSEFEKGFSGHKTLLTAIKQMNIWIKNENI